MMDYRLSRTLGDGQLNTNEINSILFVCMGNICRSPTAEAVFRGKMKQQGMKLKLDSAGTLGYHKGAKPDPRSMKAGQARGYDFSGIRARPVSQKDYASFDLILAMDSNNLEDMLAECPDQYQEKLKLFLEFGNSEYDEVPDPYYGGSRGFQLVLELIEEASEGLLTQLSRY